MACDESNRGNRRMVIIPIMVCGIMLYAMPRSTKMLYAAISDFKMVNFIYVGVGLYAYFYIKNYGKLPSIFCKRGTKLDTIIRDRIPTLKRRYMPLYWFAESRCQTILRTFLPCLSGFKYRREVVEEPNGGQFYLDWRDNDHNNVIYPNSKTRPTIFILPGVTSTSKSTYVRSIVFRLVQNGYRVMVIVNRGLDGMEVKTPTTYCATHTYDMEIAIQRFHLTFPEAKLFALGCSLGTLMLGKHLSRKGDRCGLDAALFFSCPFNAPVCAEEVEIWTNRVLINEHVAREQKRIYRRNSQVFENLVDHEKIMNARHMREFDHHFTAPLFGYTSAEEYYADCILCERKLKSVKVPLLCVGSNDDMFSPEHGLPKDEVCKTDNVALVMTYGGGHVSHLQGLNPFAETYFEQIMVEFFDAMMNNEDKS
ncbi:phospholipase ABHD3-like [Styela clava]